MPADLGYAHEAGGRARENGRDLSTCPTYAIGQLGDAWRKAWREGWHETDQRLDKGVKRGKK